MSELNYLEYGDCNECGDNTIFEYHKEIEMEDSKIVLYKCLKCDAEHPLKTIESKL